MKQNLITDVVQTMLPFLNNAQTEKLQEVLQHTLLDELGDLQMEIKCFDKEFVERTKIIVQTQCKDDFEYDVTLLLNCMLGLVSLPTERTNPSQISFKQACVDKLKNMGVIVSDTDNNKTFRTVKNALSHMNIAPQNKDGVVDSIIIKDRQDRSSPVHTELQFTVPQLKEFALFVADKHLERHANKTSSKKK